MMAAPPTEACIPREVPARAPDATRRPRRDAPRRPPFCPCTRRVWVQWSGRAPTDSEMPRVVERQRSPQGKPGKKCSSPSGGAAVAPAWRMKSRQRSERDIAKAAQMKSMRLWWNHWLAPRGHPVQQDLCEAVRSGVLPILLLGALQGIAPSVPFPKPSSTQQQTANLRKFVRMLQHAGVALHSSADIDLESGSTRTGALLCCGRGTAADALTERLVDALSDGDRATVVMVSWALILHFEVCLAESGLSAPPSTKRRSLSSGPNDRRPAASGSAAIASLLAWARGTTSSYRGVSVGSTRAAWSRAFCDGLAFCALIHAHDPRLLEFDQAERQAPERRLDLAFEIAAEAMGVPRLLETKPLLDGEMDPRCVATCVRPPRLVHAHAPAT